MSGAAPALSLRRLRKAFGAVTAVADVSLDAAPGEFLSLLGPSGCGKSTVLRMVAGLVEPDGGQVVLAGEDITRVPVHRRELGLVFQSYALFPHMTVFENVAFGLRRRRVAEGALRPRVERMLDLVRLGPLGARHPRELSGGQQQRVALARALATEPRVLLLDEPLSNLDALLRDEMRVELKRLQERLATTMIFVTHDQAEALALSDRVVVMEAGRVEQIGPPEEVYRRPATPFVARFLGRANFLPGAVAASEATGVVVHADGGLAIRAGARDGLAVGQRVQMAIRQESIRVLKPGAGGDASPNRFPATIVFHAFAGQAHHYVVQLGDGRELEVATPGAEPPLARGLPALVEWTPEDVILLTERGSRPAAEP
ncbi:MAG TPA: ABC transporter ATP-binding protein [Candidatus Methylomirabilis sp.]|nr:ABC transporter ATP-binding protein [Candidatus Methylomirabilis sp.]